MSEDRVGQRTDEALARAGMADMRPAYRRLLLRLKEADPGAFEEATRRYREDLEPAIESGAADPVTAWLEYGTWMAGELSAGSALTIDASGRARPFDPSAWDGSGLMVLHVPDDDRSPATLLAVPEAPSESQRETAELLVR